MASEYGDEPCNDPDGDELDTTPDYHYKHPICQGTYGRLNKTKLFPPEWRRAKRICPCCGREISSMMTFATHSDQRKKNK